MRQLATDAPVAVLPRPLERMFSVVWGAALFGEAVLRVVGAYTLPVDTMVWLGGRSRP
ncbi:hypothetical protein [Streptomyces venezuelae]|uniref:hypothetical protein n=1 Tax=Streptomyces venezuelae TaxID=54571 RepID=UPI001687A475|nr:hypothetical protein [Streptomyces venezuelae]